MKLANVRLLLIFVVSGCLSVGLDNQQSDPDFTWRELGRHGLVLTPFFNLMPDQSKAAKDLLEFFKSKTPKEIPEKFKEIFAETRRDVRVFGAGGAYEKVERYPDLQKVAMAVVAKRPLDADVAQELTSRLQGLRYIGFFGVQADRKFHDLNYQFNTDEKLDTLIYLSRRETKLVFAIWDAQLNRTVWLGEKLAGTSNTNIQKIENPSKKPVYNEDGTIKHWKGRALSFSLSHELNVHSGRFPGFPEVMEMIRPSYQRFALGMPMGEDEEDWVAYRNFSYHRLLVSLHGTQNSNDSTLIAFQGDITSLIYNTWRFGLAFERGGSMQKFDGEEYDFGFGGLGVVTYRRWRLSSYSRILTGGVLGFYQFSADLANPPPQPTPMPGAVETEDPGLSEGILWLGARLQLLFGGHSGLQYGAEATYRWQPRLDEPVLQKFQPAPWTLGVSLAFVIKGV